MLIKLPGGIVLDSETARNVRVNGKMTTMYDAVLNGMPSEKAPAAPATMEAPRRRRKAGAGTPRRILNPRKRFVGDPLTDKILELYDKSNGNATWAELSEQTGHPAASIGPIVRRHRKDVWRRMRGGVRSDKRDGPPPILTAQGVVEKEPVLLGRLRKAVRRGKDAKFLTDAFYLHPKTAKDMVEILQAEVRPKSDAK